MRPLPLVQRRAFLAEAARLAALGAGAPMALQALLGALAEARAAESPAEVRHYERLPGRRVRCGVCPLDCELSVGETCFCRTRTNVDGRLITRAFGNPCTLTVDPVEKGPLAHFLPGTKTLSLATGGCNVRCLYCQNWEQAQERPETLRTLDVPPAQAPSAATDGECASISYTYTEPVAFLEYVSAIADQARARSLRNVVCTAAYVKPAPLRELCGKVDAFVVTLKGFTEDFYRRVVGASLAPVQEALRVIRGEGKWLELANLVVPGLNDAPDDIARMCAWVARELGPEVPIHFEQFFPEHRLKNLPRTPRAVLEAAADVAEREGLKHVYLTNIAPHPRNHTYCAGCGALLIERLGLRRILRDVIVGGRCPSCDHAVAGVWA